ncbi:GDSL-type esterase/lipase family protein [Limosilactobacillus caecicola]|uniref:GDSL-type esterase/lipase family protein n=1 Tax=Limosilactobacillus caecicola TaxID=2941332 RepID=UPI00203A4F6A|nr:GDSL-type esterase/lipase family protein [Limosilactobacillus caecicola]
MTLELTAQQLLTQTHQTGRWFIKDQQLRSPLLGAELRFTVTNTQSLAVHTINHANPLSPSQYWAIRIDNGPWQRWAASQLAFEIPMTSDQHRVRIMTGGNCDLDDVWFQQQDFSLTKLVVDDQAIVHPVQQTKKVLVLGDSITAGCWINGKHASVDYRPEQNYIAIAQNLLPDTEIQRVAYSAAGVLRPGTGNVPPAGQWLTRLDDQQAATVGNYDSIVIALGVNDRRFSENQFRTAYRDYVQAVQHRYQSPVALMVPFRQSFHEIISRIGQELGMAVIQTTGWCHHTTDGLHPDLQGSQEAGEHFAQVLAQLVQ